MEISSCNFSFGGLITYLDYGHEIRSSAGRIFSGASGFMGSVFGTVTYNNLIVCSEVSSDNNNNYGVKFTTAYKSKHLDATIYFRSFDEMYRAPYGTMFGEFSYPANELGLYTGIV
jgi:hypothetical protein